MELQNPSRYIAVRNKAIGKMFQAKLRFQGLIFYSDHTHGRYRGHSVWFLDELVQIWYLFSKGAVFALVVS